MKEICNFFGLEGNLETNGKIISFSIETKRFFFFFKLEELIGNSKGKINNPRNKWAKGLQSNSQKMTET